MAPILDEDGYVVGFDIVPTSDTDRAKHDGRKWYAYLEIAALRDAAGRHCYTWDANKGELIDSTKAFDEDEKDRAVAKQIAGEYTRAQREELLEAAEEARIEGAAVTDPRIQAFMAARARRKELRDALGNAESGKVDE